MLFKGFCELPAVDVLVVSSIFLRGFGTAECFGVMDEE